MDCVTFLRKPFDILVVELHFLYICLLHMTLGDQTCKDHFDKTVEKWIGNCLKKSTDTGAKPFQTMWGFDAFPLKHITIVRFVLWVEQTKQLSNNCDGISKYFPKQWMNR